MDTSVIERAECILEPAHILTSDRIHRICNLLFSKSMVAIMGSMNVLELAMNKTSIHRTDDDEKLFTHILWQIVTSMLPNVATKL